MLPSKIKALNISSSDESDIDEDNPTITREALEEKTLIQYREILNLQKEHKWDEAKIAFRNLLNSDILLKTSGTLGPVRCRIQHSLLHMKYSCLKNLGNICLQKKEYKTSLEYYLEAVEIDDADLTVWFRIGKIAMKIADLSLAISAFLEGLRCNPRHWPCLDNVITVFYAIGDLLACLYYIHKAFELDSEFCKGHVLIQKIKKQHPTVLKDFSIFYPECTIFESDEDKYSDDEVQFIFDEIDQLIKNYLEINQPSPLIGDSTTQPLKPLLKKTWLTLGQTLIQYYEDLSKNDFIRKSIIFSKVGLKEKEVVAQNREENVEDMEVEQIVENADENQQGSRCKRKRSSPSLVEQLRYCDKRRSARVRDTTRKQEPSLARSLCNLIPASLMPQREDQSTKEYDVLRWMNEDSMDTMDIYRLFENKEGCFRETQASLGPSNIISSESRARVIAEEKYFGFSEEISDVKKFLSDNDEKTILQILAEFCIALSSKWNLLWPSYLSDIFIKACNIIRSYGPQNYHTIFIFNQSKKQSEYYQQSKSEVQVFLLFCELLLDEWLSKEDQSKIQSLLGDSLLGGELSTLMLDELFSVCSELNDERLNKRSNWLEALLFLHHGEMFAAIYAFSSIVCSTDDEFYLNLPNLKHNSVINKSVAQLYLDSLNWNELLREIPSLNEKKLYSQIVDILKSCLSNTNPFPEAAQPVIDRFEQYSLLLDSLLELENYEDCFAFCEASCHEALNSYRSCYSDENSSAKKVRLICIINRNLQGMLACVETIGIKAVQSLKEGRVTRLIQTLSNIMCHQTEYNDSNFEETINCTIPWILLYHVIKSTENTSDTFDSIPKSLQVLFTAHDYLGRRSWCLYDEASILFLILNIVGPILQFYALDIEIKMAIFQQVDQIFYCLYQHPYKRNKPRHVVDHNVLGLALTWNRAIQMYGFYKPAECPAFDSNKSAAISGDLESLINRLIPLVPAELNPSHLMEGVLAYLNCESEDLENVNPLLPIEVEDCYYYLADYHFKMKNWNKAIKYYLLDVCHNPQRVDSWAAMGLARGGKIEMKLNSCEPIKSEEDFLNEAMMTCQCYKRSLKIDAQHPTLWIEYGSFSYMLHSFCSRLLKQETTNLSLESFAMLEEQKEKMLQTSLECFTTANTVYHSVEASGYYILDERWLHHFMLGKIAEKKEEEPKIYIDHYIKSSQLLHHNGAKYPLTINYTNPQYYAVEALELYFRIHSTILKQLELSEDKPLPNSVRTLFKVTIENLMSSPFATFNREAEPMKVSVNSDVDENIDVSDIDGSDFITSDVTELLENLLKEIENLSNLEEEPLQESMIVCEAVKKNENNSKIEIEKFGTFDSLQIEPETNINKIEYEPNEMEIKSNTSTVGKNSNDVGTTSNVEETKLNFKTELKLESTKIAEETRKADNINNPVELMDIDEDEIKIEKKSVVSFEMNDVEKSEGVEENNIDDENLKAKLALLSSDVDSSSSVSSSSSHSSSSSSCSSSSSSSSSSTSSSTSSENSKNSSTVSDSSSASSSSSSDTSDLKSDKESAKKPKLEKMSEEVGKNWKTAQWELTQQCLNALKECSKRFPEHYKSLYRLAHYYFRSKSHRDVEESRSILLGPKGLFSDRKSNNFFNGVWRIPSGEVDRAGSFAYHMSCCVHLLMDLLGDIKDFNMLLELAIQLRDTPEPDKKYLRDNEREQLSKEAFSLSLNILRKHSQETFGSTKNSSKQEVQKALLLDIFRCYNKVTKFWPQKEHLFAKIFADCYQKYVVDKLSGNVLELATKFCQTEISAFKIATIPSEATSDVGPQVATPALSATAKSACTTPQPILTPKSLKQSTPIQSMPTSVTQQAKPVSRLGRPPGSLNKSKNDSVLSTFELKMFDLIKAVKAGMMPASILTDSEYYPKNVPFNERTNIVRYLMRKYEEHHMKNARESEIIFKTQSPYAESIGYKATPLSHSSGQNFIDVSQTGKKKVPSTSVPSIISTVKDRPNISLTPVTTSASKLVPESNQHRDSIKIKKFPSNKQIINLDQAKKLAQSGTSAFSQNIKIQNPSIISSLGKFLGAQKSIPNKGGPLKKSDSGAEINKFTSFPNSKNVSLKEISKKPEVKPDSQTSLVNKPVCSSGAVSISKTVSPNLNKSGPMLNVNKGGILLGVSSKPSAPTNTGGLLPSHISKLNSVSLSRNISLTMANPSQKKSIIPTNKSPAINTSVTKSPVTKLPVNKVPVNNPQFSGNKVPPYMNKPSLPVNKVSSVSKPLLAATKSVLSTNQLSVTKPSVSTNQVSPSANKTTLSIGGKAISASGAISIIRSPSNRTASPPTKAVNTSALSITRTNPIATATPKESNLSGSSIPSVSSGDLRKSFPKDLIITTVGKPKEPNLGPPVTVMNFQTKEETSINPILTSSPKQTEPHANDVVSALKAMNKHITIFPMDNHSK